MRPFDSSTIPPSSSETNTPDVKAIAAHCMKYKGADTKRSLFQLFSTLAIFISACIAMYFSLSLSYILTLLIAIPTAGVLCRLFIFQHDCGHQSFFKTKKANTWTGRCLSIITLMPYDFWRRSHNMHHATSGDLDRGGVGDIDVLTVKEYKALPKRKQFFYRLYRNPLVMLVIGTPIYIILGQRIPYDQGAYFRESDKTLAASSTWKSTMLTNLSLLLFYATLGLIIGYATLAAIALPIFIATSWFYGWAFYVQHQFEDSYFEKNEDWSIQEAALLGSSYYALPKVLQWFSGNIGLHHIHHVCSQIPNYKLQECMDARPELKEINRITFIESLKCVTFKLWDEDQKKMVSEY